jgi:hypothetical protein
VNRREKLQIEFAEDLSAAATCSERAVNTLLSEFGPKRRWWYQFRLKRAQKALKRLSAYEEKKKGDLE